MSAFCQRITVRIGVVFTLVVLSVAGSLLTKTAARAGQTPTDVNARDAHGMTLLDYAVEQNDIGSVLALIHAGADVNARSNTGRTALSWAALHGYIEIARALAQAGADLNVKDAQGGTRSLWHSRLDTSRLYRLLSKQMSTQIRVFICQSLWRVGRICNHKFKLIYEETCSVIGNHQKCWLKRIIRASA